FATRRQDRRRDLKFTPNLKKNRAVPGRDVGSAPVQAFLPPRQLSKKCATLGLRSRFQIKHEIIELHWPREHRAPRRVCPRLKRRVGPRRESKAFQLVL